MDGDRVEIVHKSLGDAFEIRKSDKPREEVVDVEEEREALRPESADGKSGSGRSSESFELISERLVGVDLDSCERQLATEREQCCKLALGR